LCAQLGSMRGRLPSRLVVMALAIWYSLATLGRRRVVPVPQRILIVHHLLLGDTLMLTPLLSKLRARFPKSEIVMTVRKTMLPLYQHHPYGVLACAYDPRDTSTLFSLIKHSGYDLALVPGDNRYSWLARALAGKWVVAFSGDRPAYKSWPVDELIPYPPVPATWGDMVASLVPGPAPQPYTMSQWASPDCTAFPLPQAPYCVLHVGASTPLKLWESEKWRVLAGDLTRRGYTVVWSAGQGEQKYVTEIDPAGCYHSYAGMLDLPQLWRLIKHAALMVCPDTGVTHLGRIVGVPTVALFGPGSAVICGAGDFWRFSPYRAVTIENFPCRDQRVLFKREVSWIRRCGRNMRECPEPACMQAIEATDVGQVATELLAENGV